VLIYNISASLLPWLQSPALFFCHRLLWVCDLGKRFHQIASLVRDRELVTQLKNGLLTSLIFICIIYINELPHRPLCNNHHFLFLHPPCGRCRCSYPDAACDEGAFCLKWDRIFIQDYPCFLQFCFSILPVIPSGSYHKHQVIISSAGYKSLPRIVNSLISFLHFSLSASGSR